MRNKLVLYGCIALVLSAMCGLYAVSVPQFAVISGELCASCHLDAHGGGLRTYRGWSAVRDASLISPESTGLGGLYERITGSNRLIDDRLTVGGDFRLQTMRSHESADANRRVFPMQGTVATSFRIHDNILVEGSFNGGPKKYNGQKRGTASVVFQPQYSFTQFRAGFFQPAVGIRYDDHTVLARRIAGDNITSIIPPFYAEFGAQLAYNRWEWVTITAGVFNPKSIAENDVYATTVNGVEKISVIGDDSRPSVLGRVELFKRGVRETADFSLGGSYYFNDEFSIANMFGTAGIARRLGIITEFIVTDKNGLRKTKTGVIDVSFKCSDYLYVFVRGERGDTVETFIPDYEYESYANQGTIGAQLFVLPFVELRPEYRIFDTDRYRSTRWAAQLHLFY